MNQKVRHKCWSHIAGHLDALHMRIVHTIIDHLHITY